MDSNGKAVTVLDREDNLAISEKAHCNSLKLSVEGAVLDTSKNKQILRSVIPLKSVDMVNNLIGFQFSAYHLFGYQNVLHNVLRCFPALRTEDHFVAPSINERSSTPGSMVRAFSPRLSKQRHPPSSPMIGKRLIGHSKTSRNCSLRLSAFKPLLQFMFCNHGNIIARYLP